MEQIPYENREIAVSSQVESAVDMPGGLSEQSSIAANNR